LKFSFLKSSMFITIENLLLLKNLLKNFEYLEE
jgi:hypothetical protein